jgi:DNA gyrase subunit A
MTLKDDEIVGCGIINENSQVFTMTSNGFGKATSFEKYRLQSRGGKGIINLKVNTKTGHVVGCVILDKSKTNETDLMFISKNGIIIRQQAKSVKLAGRSTAGVIMMRVKEGDVVSTIQKLDDVSRETMEEEMDEK